MPALFTSSEQAEHAFYSALQSGDLTRLMQVWSDEDDIICVHPNGLRLVGHHAVREGWQQILSQGPLPVRPSTVTVMHTMMGSVHSLIEHITLEGPQGTEQAFCYATNIFHKGPRGWRMVLHHASPAPAQVKPLDAIDTPQTNTLH